VWHSSQRTLHTDQ